MNQYEDNKEVREIVKKIRETIKPEDIRDARLDFYLVFGDISIEVRLHKN